MDEYIKRSDAIGIVEEIRDDHESRRYSNPFTMIIDSIEGTPAADVVERKIGKWVTEDDGTVVCSLCDNSAEFNPIDQSFMKMPYCSLCGARMEG